MALGNPGWAAPTDVDYNSILYLRTQVTAVGEERNKEVNGTGNGVEADEDTKEEVRACASPHHHLSPET